MSAAPYTLYPAAVGGDAATVVGSIVGGATGGTGVGGTGVGGMGVGCTGVGGTGVGACTCTVTTPLPVLDVLAGWFA